MTGAKLMAHGQWTEVEARGVVGAWKRSGLGVEAFARSRGLVRQRLYWWKKKLKFDEVAKKLEKSRPLALLPVRSERESRRGEPVTVLLRNGHVLKVGRDFDENAFARVVAILERA